MEWVDENFVYRTRDIGPVGTEIRIHKHPRRAHTLIVTDGAIRMQDGRVLREQQSLFVPMNVEHGFVSIEEGSAFICMFLRPPEFRGRKDVCPEETRLYEDA